MNEKIKVIAEKIAAKSKQVEQKIQGIKVRKSEISNLKKEISELERELKIARAEEISDAISSRGLTAETVKSAIESGFLDAFKEKPERLETKTDDFIISKTGESENDIFQSKTI
jgi:hypothetical protein